jgi:uncharacterized membrane protein
MRNSIDLLTNILTNCWSRSLVLPLMMAATMLTGYTVEAQFNVQGVAPVSSPLYGSGVDGDLDAHRPVQLN